MPETAPTSIFMLVPLNADLDQYQAVERDLHSRWPMATIAYPWIMLRRGASDKLNLQADIEILSGYTDLVIRFPGWEGSAYMRAVASLAVALGIAARNYDDVVADSAAASDDKGDATDTVPAEIHSTHLIGPAHPEYPKIDKEADWEPNDRVGTTDDDEPDGWQGLEADWKPATDQARATAYWDRQVERLQRLDEPDGLDEPVEDKVTIHHDIDTTKTTTMIIITRTETQG